MALITATGPIPVEPPVGTTLTAPGSRHAWTHTDDGWWVTDLDGNRLANVAPAGEWRRVAAALVALGGILTVTTEYQVEYRFFDDGIDDAVDRDFGEVTVITGLRSRKHVTRWRETMTRTSGGIDVLAVRSQRVTRSAWTDEPLEGGQ